MPRRSSAPAGGMVIWKPVGLTSRSVIHQVQDRLGIAGIGHCGTLDPLASGLMVLIGGVARRFQEMLTVHDKSYVATIWFGIRSHSGDGEGPLTCPYPRVSIPSREAIEEVLPQFLGLQKQVPPVHSAVRVGRQRSYERARQGDHTPPPSREVRIDALSMVDFSGPRLRLQVDCGPGTYIRSLARDLGEALDCPASLLGLRRTRAGFHSLEDARSPDRVVESDWRTLEQLLRDQPAVEIDPDQAIRLGHGQFIDLEEMVESHSLRQQEEQQLVAWCDGQVRGIVRVRAGQLRSRRWIPQRGADPVTES